MSFFYDLNKRLQQVLDTPKSEHQQLNEGWKGGAAGAGIGAIAGGPVGAAVGSVVGDRVGDEMTDQSGVNEGATPASPSKIFRLIKRQHNDWFDNYGMGEVEDTVMDMHEMGQFEGMSAEDAVALVGQELESLYGPNGMRTESSVAKYQDLGANQNTTHFLKNMTTGKIVSPHRGRHDAEDALVAATRGSNDEFKIVRARKSGVSEGDRDGKIPTDWMGVPTKLPRGAKPIPKPAGYDEYIKQGAKYGFQDDPNHPLRKKFKGSQRDMNEGDHTQLDELSPWTLGSYADKAKQQGAWARGVAYNPSTPGAGERGIAGLRGPDHQAPKSGSEAGKYNKLADKRFSGAARAVQKGAFDHNKEWADKVMAAQSGMNEGDRTQHALDLNPDLARQARKPGVADRVGSAVRRATAAVVGGDDPKGQLLNRMGGVRTPLARVYPELDEGEAAQPTGYAAKFASSMHDRIKNATEEQLADMAWKFAGDSASFDYEYNLLKKAQQELLGGYAAQRSQGIQQRLNKTLRTKYPNITVSEGVKEIPGGRRHTSEPGGYGRKDDEDAPKTKTQRGRGRPKKDADASGEVKKYDWSAFGATGKDVKLPKHKGEVTRHKMVGETTKEIPGGRRHTADAGGYGRKDDEDAPKVKTQRGRGRPKKGGDSETGEVKKYDWSAFGATGKDVKLPKHKGAVTKHKMVGEEVSDDDRAVLERLMDEAFAEGKNALGNAIQGVLEMMSDEEQVNEKAVSKSQRAAAGIAYAAKKGDLPRSELKGASREMAKMPAGELKKFAKTKEKGLPEKVATKKKTESASAGATGSGSVAATAGSKGKGGMSFGKGIYDSMNRELEGMIAESMNVSLNMNSDAHGGPSKSITVTATDDDADRLAELLKMAGMGHSDHGDCGCGASPCSCDDVEVVDENSPDWPTNPEYSDDALQYSGGLNKPKTDVGGDGQTTVPVGAVRVQQEDEDLRRMMEMAGIEEAKKAKPDFLDVDKDGDKEEPFKKAVKDKKEAKVDESIFAMTRNLWTAYKG